MQVNLNKVTISDGESTTTFEVEINRWTAIRMMLIFLMKHIANILALEVISAICFPHLTMTNEGWIFLLVTSMNLERIKNYRVFLYGGFFVSCVLLDYFL